MNFGTLRMRVFLDTLADKILVRWSQFTRVGDALRRVLP
jgi:hypothetical protein